MNFLDHFKNKRIYFCTDSDLDGVSCHIVSLLYVQPVCSQFLYTITSKRDMSEFNKVYAQHSDIVCFADITPTVELYLYLTKDLNKEVYIFDHHQGVRDELLTVIDKNYFFTTEKCGTKILFDTITQGVRVKKAVYEFVEKVDVYDRYVTESALWKEAKDLHNIMYGYVNWFSNQTDDEKYNKFINAQLQKFKDAKYFYFTDYEKELAEKGGRKEKENMTQAEKSLKFRTDNSNNKYAYFECSSKLSVVAMTLTKKYPDIDYFIGHSTFLESAKNTPNGKISLRCKDGFDVTVIAQKWGGSGHKQASGAELTLKDFQKLREGKMHLI